MDTRAEAVDVLPFYTRDQGPFSQVFGLPPTEGGLLVPAGRLDGRLVIDIANSDSGEWLSSREQLELDGETLRLTLSLRYGLAKRMEIGLDIPYVSLDEGVLDGFMDTFHDISGLPLAPKPKQKYRLVYSYMRDGVTEVDIRDSTSGVGDLLLSFGYQLSGKWENPAPRAISLRAGLKLPTGDPGSLRGSGSTDFSLRLAATDAATFSRRNITLFGEAGAMWMGRGEILEKQQRSVAGFGTLGLGWSPLSWLALKIQVETHSAFYRDSVTDVLASQVYQVVAGGTFALPWETTLDVGITENFITESSPDVTFHFALRKRFGETPPGP